MKERYDDINEYIHDLQEAIEKDPKCAIHHIDPLPIQDAQYDAHNKCHKGKCQYR